MRYKEPEKKTYYARDIFRDLSSARPALAKLKGRGKAYDELIDILMTLGEDDPYPASKDLQQRFGLSSGRLKKLIDELYDDFKTGIFEDATLLQFPQVEHHFYVRGYDDSISFNCQLPVTPRAGEELELPFLRAVVSTPCYVTDVKYTLENGKVTVAVWARIGFYNEHREYLRAKAEFEGKLNWESKLQHDYVTERQLKEIYPERNAVYQPPVTGHKPGQNFNKRRY